MLAFTAQAAGQSPPAPTAGSVDAATLEALCAANTPDEAALANCLAVVHIYLVPGSGTDQTATPPESPAAAPPSPSGPSLGYTFVDPNLAVSLLRVEWVTAGTPEPERQWISIYVRYVARTGADYSTGDDWKVSDQNDAGARLVDPTPKEPALTGGQVAKGESVEGWMTFQLPVGLTRINVTYSDGLFGDEHEWVVDYDPSAGPVITATPMPTPKRTHKPKPTPRPTYKQLSKRDWQRLVRSPDDHIDERVQVWACISQFDAATGDDTFRGEAANKRLGQYDWFISGDNALFTGDADRLDAFVKDDVVSMNAIVGGSFTYDTQNRREHHCPDVRRSRASADGAAARHRREPFGGEPEPQQCGRREAVGLIVRCAHGGSHDLTRLGPGAMSPWAILTRAGSRGQGTRAVWLVVASPGVRLPTTGPGRRRRSRPRLTGSRPPVRARPARPRWPASRSPRNAAARRPRAPD